MQQADNLYNMLKVKTAANPRWLPQSKSDIDIKGLQAQVTKLIQQNKSNGSGGGNNNNNNNNNTCNYCKKKGHKEATCRKKKQDEGNI